MEKKRDLAKLAMVALLLASNLPVDGQANSLSETTETFLAMGGCAAHGCGGDPAPKPKKNSGGEIADNSSTTNSYDTSSNTYQVGGNNPGYGNTTPGMTNSSSTSTSTGTGKTSGSNYFNDANRMKKDQSSSRNTNETYESTRGYNDTYDPYSSYNTNRNYQTSPGYVESFRNSTLEVDTAPYGANTNMNRDYNTASDYDYNRPTTSTMGSSLTLTESQLLGLLNSQGRAIFLNLDAEGKAYALQLASQDSYRDKNLAVKEAQRRMNERRGIQQSR